MLLRTAMVAGGFALTLGVSGAAWAQSAVEIEATTREARPKFEIIRPEAPGSEPSRSREADFYREDARVNYDPAFIEPFVGETEGGVKFGLSGWSSPRTQGDKPAVNDQAGWLSFGFTIAWGGPTRAERRAAVKPTSAPAPR